MESRRDEAGRPGWREKDRVRERERETESGKAVMKEVLIFYRSSLIRSCTDIP